MNLISQLSVEGFRSVRKATVALRPLNVLIGANGAGKSNLVDFLRMLNSAVNRGLQEPYLRERGPASAILHFGSKVTGVIRGELTFATDVGANWYRFTLADSAGDRLTFTKEEVEHGQVVPLIQHPSDNSGLAELWAENDPTARFTREFLRECRAYQFHDTGLTSPLRDYAPTDQSRHLHADGGNLAAILLDLRQTADAEYAAIVRTLRAILPWFEDFVLEEEGRKGVLLRWRTAGHGDHLFGPGQLSDGSLQIMALVTLLSLPPDRLPSMLILDEPELGLHPAAERVVAGLVRNVSRDCQVLLSTQSATFVDHFSADDVLVVENDNGESRFVRQSTEALRGWLERYSLGQIWSKDIIGGRPG